MEFNKIKLQNLQPYVPEDMKKMSACAYCKLILDERQWEAKKFKCPNCKNDADLKDFNGMITVMMPPESWVAKWNGLNTKMPGVYAMHLLDNDVEVEKQELLGYGNEIDTEQLNDFIVDDGEGEEEYRGDY